MILPRRLGLWLSLLVATRVAIAAAADAFAYDHNADFAIEEKSTQARDGVTVRDISFVAVPGRDDGRIDAFLVTPPAGGAGAQAGILWVHWLGDPATSNRTQFLDEAVALAREGVVSLLPDAMWSRPHWYRDRVLDEDYANSVRQVIALRRALDLLIAQPGVARSRLAFVGHDYGAMYGIIAVSVHGGIRTAVLVAPTASLNDWAFFLQRPASMEGYLEQNRPLDLSTHLRAAKNLSVFMQFAEEDRYVPLPKAEGLFSAANEPREMRVYPGAGHEMTSPAAIREDRDAWLRDRLGLRNDVAKPPE